MTGPEAADILGRGSIEDPRGREKLRRLFDHVSFAVFLAGYVTVNLVLILAARS